MSAQLRRIHLGRETPPAEFLLWAFGVIDTVKGRYPFSRADGENVVAAFNDVGNRLPFFYKHLAVKDGEIVDPYEERRGAGSALLDLRDDGLWIVDIRWTDPAAAQVGEREWLYVSPEFGVDKTTKAIVELWAIALTNTPATKNAPQLVAASREGTPMDPEEQKKADEAAAAALAAVPPPAEAPPVADEPPAPQEPDGDELSKAVGRHRAAMEELAASHAACRALGIDGYDGSPYDAPKKTMPAAASADAPPMQPPVQQTEARAMSRTTTALAGVAASKSNEVVALSRQVAELERREKVRDAQGLVDEAVRLGHVMPAERSELVALGTDDAPALAKMLKIFAGRTPAAATVTAAGTQPAALTNGNANMVPVMLSGRAQPVMLDATEIRVGAAMGHTVEQIAASKVALMSRPNGIHGVADADEEV